MTDPNTAPTTQQYAPEPAIPLTETMVNPVAEETRGMGTEAASGLRLHPDPSLTTAATSPEQEVDPRREIKWVRPTDLVERMSARAAERGVEWNVRAHEWARTQARAAISDARMKAASAGRTITARFTRTGPDPVEQEAARL